jgi:hypothetical protein
MPYLPFFPPSFLRWLISFSPLLKACLQVQCKRKDLANHARCHWVETQLDLPAHIPVLWPTRNLVNKALTIVWIPY